MQPTSGLRQKAGTHQVDVVGVRPVTTREAAIAQEAFNAQAQHHVATAQQYRVVPAPQMRPAGRHGAVCPIGQPYYVAAPVFAPVVHQQQQPIAGRLALGIHNAPKPAAQQKDGTRIDLGRRAGQ